MAHTTINHQQNHLIQPKTDYCLSLSPQSGQISHHSSRHTHPRRSHSQQSCFKLWSRSSPADVREHGFLLFGKFIKNNIFNCCGNRITFNTQCFVNTLTVLALFMKGALCDTMANLQKADKSRCN